MDVWREAAVTPLKHDNGSDTYIVILSDIWLDQPDVTHPSTYLSFFEFFIDD
jgi:hypothetical protein